MSPTEEQMTKLAADAGLRFAPTVVTYYARSAVAGEGPLAHEWQDKPHRLVYDLCTLLEADAALRAAPSSLSGLIREARAMAADIEALPNSADASAASLAISEVVMALGRLAKAGPSR